MHSPCGTLAAEMHVTLPLFCAKLPVKVPALSYVELLGAKLKVCLLELRPWDLAMTLLISHGCWCHDWRWCLQTPVTEMIPR